ncbi:MAG: hypothetical protein IKO57_11930 [Treponema sp.]|nr:hypothetical protein [Treponema sp.]
MSEAFVQWRQPNAAVVFLGINIAGWIQRRNAAKLHSHEARTYTGGRVTVRWMWMMFQAFAYMQAVTARLAP